MTVTHSTCILQCVTDTKCMPAELPVHLYMCACRYYWFMIAMQLVSLIGLTILSCMRLMAAAGLSWLAWFTVLTALFIQGR